MSEFRDLQRDTVLEREIGTRESCRNLQDGTEFTAEIEPVENMELNEPMGRDPREAVKMYVSDRTIAGNIVPQGMVAVCLYGHWEKFVVCRRENNPAKSQIEFGLKYQTAKDSNG